MARLLEQLCEQGRDGGAGPDHLRHQDGGDGWLRGSLASMSDDELARYKNAFFQQ